MSLIDFVISPLPEMFETSNTPEACTLPVCALRIWTYELAGRFVYEILKVLPETEPVMVGVATEDEVTERAEAQDV